MDSSIVVALIGLVGTFGVAALGYRRWSADRREKREAAYGEERRTLYRSFWERLEAVSVALRRDSVPTDEFRKLVADLNEFMLRNIHIEERHRVLANEYLGAVEAFHQAVLDAGSEAEIPYGTTQDIPPEVVAQARRLRDAQQAATSLREALRSQVQPIVAGSRES